VLAGVAAIGVIVMVLWAIWRVPSALYGYVPEPKDRASAEASTRVGMLAGLAGVVAFGTLVVAARTYRITERGHLTDRYTKAIEQLGDGNLDVRLGGIYALEQLAADSPKTRDQSTIVEVLSAFVRVHSQPEHDVDDDDDEDAQDQPSEDIQAAVTVLARLPQRKGVRRADLHGAYLRGVVISRGQVTMFDTSRGRVVRWSAPSRHEGETANMRGAIFAGADLAYAVLNSANLSEAVFSDADLSGAMISGADLTGARLEGADLEGAMLDQADLSHTSMEEADLTRTWLADANLTGVHDLTQEQLDDAIGTESTRLPDGLTRPESWTGSPPWDHETRQMDT
jgi:hypothetical protein